MPPLCFAITPSGSFRIEGLPDGSVLVRAPAGQEAYLDRFATGLLQTMPRVWGATRTGSRRGELLLIPKVPDGSG